MLIALALAALAGGSATVALPVAVVGGLALASFGARTFAAHRSRLGRSDRMIALRGARQAKKKGRPPLWDLARPRGPLSADIDARMAGTWTPKGSMRGKRLYADGAPSGRDKSGKRIAMPTRRSGSSCSGSCCSGCSGCSGSCGVR